MTTLKFGSRGSEVKTLQQKLNELNKAGLSVDSIFGAKTEEAVKAFQKAKNLDVDGIVGPKTWAALGVTTSSTQTARKINMIVVHCAATTEGKEYTAQTISNWHQARNFSSYTDAKTGKKMYVGYHYLIHLDGEIEPCRPESVKGCHVANYNTNSIGICYIGGVDKNGKAKDTRTPAQKESLIKLLKEMKAKYPGASIHGHREFAAKACPSFDAKKEYASL